MVKNLELRTKALTYSLELEDSINTLLLMNLGIFDGGKKTRLFSNKSSISYKNKIDLLFDIEVLSKEENADLELLSIFRNKLLHDVESDSMLTVLSNLDNGLVNKFKSHLDENGIIANEKDCEIGLINLYRRNIVTIKEKTAALRIKSEHKTRFLQLNLAHTSLYIDAYYTLIDKICEQLEQTGFENSTDSGLSQDIFAIIESAIERSKQEDFVSLEKEKAELLNDPKLIANLIGIKRMPEKAKQEGLERYEDFKKLQTKEPE